MTGFSDKLEVDLIFLAAVDLFLKLFAFSIYCFKVMKKWKYNLANITTDQNQQGTSLFFFRRLNHH